MTWIYIEKLFSEAMMNLYQPNNRIRSGRRRLLLATILVVFLFAIDILTGGVVRARVRAIGGFIYQHGVGTVEAIASTGFFSTRHSLESRIEALSAEVGRLNEQSADDRALKDENQQLRGLVHLAAEVEGITAPIVSSFRTSPYGTFLVGAGNSDGATRGDLVLSPGGFVIGTVADVGPHTSVVKEVFAPNTSIDAVINGSATLVEGRGKGNAYARLPHGIPVASGDIVISPVFGGRAVGIVGSATSDSASAYSNVYVGLPVSVESLRYVYIAKK